MQEEKIGWFGRRRWSRRFAIGAMSVAAIGAAGIGFAHAHGPGGHGGQGWGQRDPAQMQRFMEERLRRALTEVGANEVQQTQVTDIMRAAMTELMPLREQGRNARQTSMRLLAQPTVDRAQLEVLRQQQVSLHDQVTKRMTQAFADVADVLTPDQRAKFAERFQRRMRDWRGPGISG